MRRTNYSFYQSLLLIFDWLLLMIVIFLVNGFFPSIKLFKQQEYVHLFYVLNLTWIASSFMLGIYTNSKWYDFFVFSKRSIKSFLLMTFFVMFFLFVYKFPYSRLYIFTILSAFLVTLIISRIIFYFVMLAAKNRMEKRVVIIGDNEAASRLVNYFNSLASLVRVKACFIDEYNPGVVQMPAMAEVHYVGDVLSSYAEEPSGSVFAAAFARSTNTDVKKRRHLHERLLARDFFIRSLIRGDIKECLSFAIDNDIAEIYCTISPELRPELYELAKQAEKQFIQVKFIPDYTQFIRKAVLVDYVDDLPILTLRPFPLEDFTHRFLKRSLDVVVSLSVILFIMSWLIPLLALIIKWESRGSVFFTQLRSGRNNRPFKCIKFRSLKTDNEHEAKQVTKNDSRVTKIGRFLRKSNIDELPQFFNVLIGNMSVVGPRPHMLKHTVEFDGLHHEYMVRHFVKPGVTGLAQVNGYRGEIRNPELLRKRVEYDIQYLENWSLGEDIRIILATIFVSLRGDKNAY